MEEMQGEKGGFLPLADSAWSVTALESSGGASPLLCSGASPLLCSGASVLLCSSAMLGMSLRLWCKCLEHSDFPSAQSQHHGVSYRSRSAGVDVNLQGYCPSNWIVPNAETTRSQGGKEAPAAAALRLIGED